MWLQATLLVYGIISPFTSASVINAKKLLSSDNDKSDACETPECIKTAALILNNMDSSVDPCDDFYKFACGNFEKKHSIPEDKTNIGIFTDLNDQLMNQLRELYERELDGSEPHFIKLVKNVYDSCMNTEQREGASSEPLKKFIKLLGGWPIIEGENWDASNFDWLESVLKARSIGAGYSTLINVGVNTDTKNNKRRIIEIDQPSLGMPNRDYLLHGLSDKATKTYFDMMIKAANKLGANPETSEKELLDALNFEIGLAKISIPNEERRDFDAMYNLYTIKELQELTPQIDWLKLINGILLDPVTEQEKVVVSSPKFLKDFSEYISKADKRTIANYMIWRSVMGSMTLLSQEWKDIAQEYLHAVIGLSKEQPQSEQCIGFLTSNIPIAVGAYYAKNYFPPESRDKANELLSYIHNEFHKILENIDWMDEDTRKAALDKANAMDRYIGYPEELLNDSLVSEYHKNISASPDDYFNNNLKIEKWANDVQIAKLRQPKIRGDWKEHSNVAVVNCFYSGEENSIDFPAGILQEPYFSKDGLHFMNFGGIGMLMGHEITHGFDDMGKQFDEEGNNKNWWANSTDKQFTEKANCIIDQYAGYTADNGMKLNGINTQGENIADNGGLKETYRAYNAWVKDNAPELKLPGLKYTTNQLFWIGAANSWCSKSKPESMKMQILSDNHSPSPFRVIGPMSNLAEFSKDFNCPLGSGMNPHKKCEVW